LQSDITSIYFNQGNSANPGSIEISI